MEINLNKEGALNDNQLFHLFVLAVLWNNKPTFRAAEGERVFLKIKQEYTLKNFTEAAKDNALADRLKSIALCHIRNPEVFYLLMFIANKTVAGENVWAKVKRILNLPSISDRKEDVNRLRELYRIFNPRKYEGEAYFTVKTFLIFREIRIQFRDTGKYQYHPVICCIPDSNVRNAIKTLNLLDKIGSDIDSLIEVSEIVTKYFCTETYDLYDLPLFFWYKENKPNLL